MNNCTPCCEDWWETIWFDGTDKDFIKAVRGRADNFDIDEEVEVYISCRGEYGVPSNTKDLIEDAEWKKSALDELAGDLEKLNFEEVQRMEDKISFTQEELQLLYTACMNFGDKLAEIKKSIPDEKTDNLSERAKASWSLARKITEYMEG